MKRKEFESRYAGIGELLQEHKGNKEIRLTFGQIEKKVGKLPPSAKKFHTWWANNRTPKAPCRHSRVWLTKGYVVKSVDLKKGEVLFVKARNARKKLSRAEVILKAARKLYEEGKKIFTRKELAIKISHLFPKVNYKLTSIDAAIQAMQEGSNSFRLVGKNWRETLRNVKRGYFTLTEKGLIAKKESVKPKPKKDIDIIKEKLEEEFKTNFTRRSLKINKNLEIPLDLWSEEKKIAGKIYNLKNRKIDIKAPIFSKIFQDSYMMEKANIKFPLLIFKRKKMRREKKDQFIKEIKNIFKKSKVYLYEKNRVSGEGNLIKL